MVGSLDPLAVPSKEILQEIAAKQDARASEIRDRRRAQQELTQLSEADFRSEAAASMIQRNYRGYRARRALRGHGLDANTRWLEAMKEARYRKVTSPISRDARMAMSSTTKSRVRDRWKRAGAIASHAGNDDTSESESEHEHDADEERAQRKATRNERRKKKSERETFAKTMGLEYFLEMVDHKHRYGSNLRRYHAEWKTADTHDNFFHWLDYGEGRDLDLEDRPRKRLDTEHVRYLSREERQRYLAKIDEQGRFCWALDNEPITTSVDYKDSINGIVPVDDDTPTWREVQTGVAPEPSPFASDSSSISGISTGSHEDSSKYANEELHEAKGIRKLNHITVDSLMNHLLRKTTKKNTWIFVADTSFRLYIGIKQSGAFQHSSFLKGARISAAGLIKIKRGQLRKLSPLSGHYAPPVRNFRAFVHALQEAGADLTNCNISRSYAVLLGLEGYLGVKKHVKSAEQTVKDILDPDEKQRRLEAEKDKSESAEKERRFLQQEQERLKETNSLTAKVKRLSLGKRDDVGGVGETVGSRPATAASKSTPAVLENMPEN